METIRWDDVKDWFDPVENGSAPDVVVPDATPADWETLFGLIRSERWRCEYESGDERRPLPATAAELLRPDPDWSRSLWVWPAPDLEWIIRMWSTGDIVGDVSLHQIQGQGRLDTFCRFLRILGTNLGKTVHLYAEGADDSYPPIMAYDPAADRVLFLAGPWRQPG